MVAGQRPALPIQSGCRPAAGTTDSKSPGARPVLPCSSHAHQPTVEGRRGWVGGTLSRMDAATELTRVRALCLRGTALQAPERPAASGWAGPRSGTCSVSRQPTRAGLARPMCRAGALALALAVSVTFGGAAAAAEHGSALPPPALTDIAPQKRQKPGRGRAFAVLPAGSRRIPRQARWISAWRTGWRDVPCAGRPSYARLHGRHGS